MICCCGLTVFTCVLLTCVSLFNVLLFLFSLLTYIYDMLVKTCLVYVSCCLLLCTFSDCLLSMYFSVAETFLDSCLVDFAFRHVLMFAFCYYFPFTYVFRDRSQNVTSQNSLPFCLAKLKMMHIIVVVSGQVLNVYMKWHFSLDTGLVISSW